MEAVMCFIGGFMWVLLALPWIVILGAPIAMLLFVPTLTVYSAYRFISRNRRFPLRLEEPKFAEIKFDLSA